MLCLLPAQLHRRVALLPLAQCQAAALLLQWQAAVKW